MCNMPRFKASDALSTITESTTQGGEENSSEGSFDKLETGVWSTALRQSMPSITANAKNATKSPAPHGVAGGRVMKDKRKVKVSGAANKAVSTAASSSGQ